MTQKQTISQWVATPAIRDPIRMPPDIMGVALMEVAHVVAFIRGLLLDDRLTVRDDYWAYRRIRDLLGFPNTQTDGHSRNSTDFVP